MEEQENSTKSFTEQRKFIEEFQKIKDILGLNLDVIQSALEEDEKLFGKFIKFRSIFNFKFANILISFVEIEETIMKSPSDHYYEELLGSEGEIRTQNKISRQLDSILTQYFSITDIFVKTISEIIGIDGITTLGELYSKEEILGDKKKIYETFFQKKETFNNLKAHRDYLIHHGKIIINRAPETEENKEFERFSHYIPKIERNDGRNYKQSRTEHQKINFLIRQGILNLMESCVESLYHLEKIFISKA